PDNFSVYGRRVVPFYNYLQAALVVHEDGRLPAEAVLRVGVELVVHHRFDGDALGRSYLDLVRRGHLRGSGAEGLVRGFEVWAEDLRVPGYKELKTLVARLPQLAETARAASPSEPSAAPDYLKLVEQHN